VLEELPGDKMPKLSQEDEKLWKEATKEYNRLKMREHRAWQTDLSIKFQLKKAALAALPGASLQSLCSIFRVSRVLQCSSWTVLMIMTSK
jgi:hypothetical protein